MPLQPGKVSRIKKKTLVKSLGIWTPKNFGRLAMVCQKNLTFVVRLLVNRICQMNKAIPTFPNQNILYIP